MVICSNKELTKLSAILRRSPLAVINNTVLQSSTLTSLTLTIPGTYYYPERNGGLKLQPIDCPLLESLELHCDNETSYMDQDFPGSRMPHLKRFHVTIDAPLYPEEVIQPFFRSVMRCGPNRLKSLSLHSRWAKTPVDLAIKIEHLHPLMNPPLAGLDSIHISGYFRSRLTNQDLVSLGRANPHLTKLHIGPHIHQKQSVSPDIFWDPRPEIDLQGLISFIHTLPTLLYLGISVSALPRSTPIGFESPGLVVPGLRKWDVCVSDIEEPEKVASMLITHLPHLEQVIMHQVMIFWPRFHPLMTSTSDFPENRDLKRCLWGFRVVDDLVREAHATRKAVL
ncbi:hypothetical protein FRC03_011949 [Tulasnella sp. 419]|nr:hypothetical protein FRC03_011949 [Tulasnella sp. 419]